MKLLVCTWNLGNAEPPRDLSPWIPTGGGDYDVIVVGVQEAKYKPKAPGSATAAGAESAAADSEGLLPKTDAGALAEDSDVDSDAEAEALGAEALTGPTKPLKSRSEGPMTPTDVPPPGPPGEDSLALQAAAAALDAAGSPASATAAPSVVVEPAPAAPAASSRELLSPGAASPASPDTARARAAAGKAGPIVQGSQTLLDRLKTAGTSGDDTPVFKAIAAFLGGNQQDAAATGAAAAPATEGGAAESAAVGGAGAAPLPAADSAYSGSGSASGEWLLLRSVMMYQTGVAVFLRSRLAPGVRQVDFGMEATGVMGVGANKGAVAIGVDIDGTRLVFINAHLAAHMKHVAARNANLGEILSNLAMGSRPRVQVDAAYHHCFFLGDLNYRVDLAIKEGGARGVDEPEHRARVRAAIAEGRTAELLACDQLAEAKATNAGWAGFNEAPITFQPTFSMLRRKHGFEYAAKRVPSWCDRVLWKSLPAFAADIKCTAYAAHGSVASSDHKPVSAAFELTDRPLSSLVVTPAGGALAPESMPRLVFVGGVRGTDLAPMDVSGKSDPYMMFFTDPAQLLHVPAAAGFFARIGAGMGMSKVKSSSAMSAAGAAAAGGAGAAYAVEAAIPGPGAVGGEPITETVKTPFVTQNVNPVWEQSKLPALSLRASRPEELANAHLVIVIMDYDRMDSHDFMGQIVLPLGRLASGEPVAFDEPVLLSSVVKGRLAGTLQLQWPAGSVPAAAAAAAPSPAETATPASPEGRAALPVLATPVGGSAAEGAEWGARPSTPKASTGCGSLCQVQ